MFDMSPEMMRWVFQALIIVMGNGVARLDERNVYIVVPPEGAMALLAHRLADLRIVIQSEPPGADVWLHELVEEGFVLVERNERKLGMTPLAETPLPMGSYLVVLRHEGYPDTRYPVFISRNAEWRGTVRLTTQEEIGLRGAQTAVALAEPEIGISIEAGVAADFPGIGPTQAQERLGGGPGIFLLDSSMIPNRKFRDFMFRIADETGIPLHRCRNWYPHLG